MVFSAKGNSTISNSSKIVQNSKLDYEWFPIFIAIE